MAVLPGGQYNQDHPWVAETRSWLAAVALAVPDELGTAARLEAYGDDDVTLAYVEGSFILDLFEVELALKRSWAGRHGLIGPLRRRGQVTDC